jgi:hypothetical protein
MDEFAQLVERPTHELMTWAHPLLERAMASSLGETADSVSSDIIAERSRLWILGQFGLAVTKVIEARKRVFQIVAIVGGGKTPEMVADTITAFEREARRCGCDLILACGRPGWEKDMVRNGFSVEKITAVKEVSRA